MGVLGFEFRFEGLDTLPSEENETIFVVPVPDHSDDIALGVVLKESCRLERREVSGSLHIHLVAEYFEVVTREAFWVATANRLFVLSLPQLYREVLPTELFKR